MLVIKKRLVADPAGAKKHRCVPTAYRIFKETTFIASSSKCLRSLTMNESN